MASTPQATPNELQMDFHNQTISFSKDTKSSEDINQTENTTSSSTRVSRKCSTKFDVNWDEKWHKPKWINYAYTCQYLLTGTTICFRHLFDSICNPLFLEKRLAKMTMRRDLWELRRQEIISAEFWHELYPTKAATMSETYNANLLRILLKYTCQIPPPYPNGWNGEPDKKDRSLAASIARIDQIHLKLIPLHKLTNTERREFLDNISATLQDIDIDIANSVDVTNPTTKEEVLDYLNQFQVYSSAFQEIKLREDDMLAARKSSTETSQSSLKSSAKYNKQGNKDKDTREDHAVIIKYLKPLTQQVWSEDILPSLRNQEVITVDEDTIISISGCNSDRMRSLLQIIMKKPESAFLKFMNVLMIKHQGLHDRIMKTLKEDSSKAKEGKKASLIETVTKYYKDRFSLHIPIPWYSITTDLKDMYCRPYITTLDGQSLSIEDIFNMKTNKKTAACSLLHGERGSGKTTLCQLLAYKWALGEWGQQYKLVVLLDLKLVQSDSLWEIVAEQILPTKSKIIVSVVEWITKELEKQLLFILDGYDHMINKELIEPLIQKELLANSSILLTTSQHCDLPSWFNQPMFLLGLEQPQELVNVYGKLSAKPYKYQVLLQRVDTKNDLSTPEVLELWSAARNPEQCLSLCLQYELKNRVSNPVHDRLGFYHKYSQVDLCDFHFEDLCGLALTMMLQSNHLESKGSDMLPAIQKYLQSGFLMSGVEKLENKVYFSSMTIQTALAANKLATMADFDLLAVLDTLSDNNDFRVLISQLCKLITDRRQLKESIAQKIAQAIDMNIVKEKCYLEEFQLVLLCLSQSSDLYPPVADLLPSEVIMSRKPIDVNLVNGLSCIVQNNPESLRKLEIRLEHFANYQLACMLELAKSISVNTHLTILILRWSILDLLGAFLDRVMQTNESIKEIHFFRVHEVDQKNINTKAYADLQKTLRKAININKIYFNDCLDNSLIAMIVKYLPVPVECLHLQNCNLQADAATEIALLLGRTNNLRELNLKGAKLGYPEVLQITSYLKLNNSLRLLDLSDTNLDTNSLALLVQTLSFNRKLEVLKLDGIQLPDNVCKALASTLKDNKNHLASKKQTHFINLGTQRHTANHISIISRHKKSMANKEMT